MKKSHRYFRRRTFWGGQCSPWPSACRASGAVLPLATARRHRSAHRRLLPSRAVVAVPTRRRELTPASPRRARRVRANLSTVAWVCSPSCSGFGAAAGAGGGNRHRWNPLPSPDTRGRTRRPARRPHRRAARAPLLLRARRPLVDRVRACSTSAPTVGDDDRCCRPWARVQDARAGARSLPRQRTRTRPESCLTSTA